MLSSRTLIADLLQASPHLASLLIELRVDCVGCFMNKFCTIEDLCARYDLEQEQVISRIRERLPQSTE